jgi:hypothetical protein
VGEKTSPEVGRVGEGRGWGRVGGGGGKGVGEGNLSVRRSIRWQLHEWDGHLANELVGEANQAAVRSVDFHLEHTRHIGGQKLTVVVEDRVQVSVHCGCGVRLMHVHHSHHGIAACAAANV